MAARLAAKQAAWSDLDRHQCAQRKVRAGIAVTDPSGNRIELVTGVQVSGRRFYAGRDSGVVALSSVGLRSWALADDVEFWTALGADISDRVGDITYLRMDDAHHRIALYPSSRTGILYVSLAVQSHDHLMQNSYFLADHQIRIVHGPGLETASGRIFLRFEGPNDQLFSLEYDEGRYRPGAPPRQFELSVAALCSWGSRCDAVSELAAPAAST
ncbi:MAG: VOC family protein [Bradyrhizobium sp.]